MSKKVIFLFIAVGLCAPLAFAARVYRSPRYALREANTVVSRGQCESARYRLKDIVIGAVFAGQAKSAHYGISFRVGAQTAPESEENRPNPPVVYPLSSPTNKPEQHLSGKKAPGTAIYINGYPAAARDDKTDWSAKVTLVEGVNYLLITSRGRNGAESTSVLVSSTLDTIAPEVIITSPLNNATVTTPRIMLKGSIDGTPFNEEKKLQPGKNILTKETKDTTGNIGSASVTVILTAAEEDSTPPCITITYPVEHGTVTCSPITISGTVDDPEAQVTIELALLRKIQATVIGTTFKAKGIALEYGLNTIKVSAVDSSGNIGDNSIDFDFKNIDGARVEPTAHVIDQNNFEITYNEYSVFSADKAINYTISPELGKITVKEISYDETSHEKLSHTLYRLTTSDSAIAGVTYTITVKDRTSDGRYIDPNHNTATFVGPIPIPAAKLLVTMQGEQDTKDKFGCSVASAGDVNGDVYSDVLVGAYGYSSPGKTRLYFGGHSMNGITDITLASENPSNDDSFGYSVASCGDINCDAYPDVIVGSPTANNETLPDYYNTTGKAYIYFGGRSMDGIADIVLSGEKDDQRFGHSVASAGDINGDGYGDIIVGAPHTLNEGTGKAYIYFGGPSMDNIADAVLEGKEAGDRFGYSVASAGDLNHDGYCDIIVGATEDSTNISSLNNKGKAYIYFGGRYLNTIVDLVISGENDGHEFGYSVASCGDINNDGFSDILVGAAGTSKAYIYFGAYSMDDQADLVLKSSNEFGASVASAGDINNDGFPDIIIGARKYRGPITSGEKIKGEYLGKACIYLGGPGMDDTCDISITGTIKGNLGCSVASAGDTNRDGHDEFIIGASEVNNGRGEAYVYTWSPETNHQINYFTVFALDTKDRNHTDSPTVGISLYANVPDSEILKWLITESSQKPKSVDFTQATKPATYTITGGDGNRTLYAWAIDREGNITELSADSQDTIFLDTTAPILKITSPANDSLFSSSSINVSGSITDLTNTIVTINTIKATLAGTNFSANGIPLQQGSNVITATAVDLLGHTSSDTITVTLDATPPTCPTVIDDGESIMSLSQLHASWSSADLESGIKEYIYAIGTTPKGTNFLDWTSAGKDTQVTCSNLVLEQGKTYYFTVIAVNGMGMESEPGVSDGITSNLTGITTWITYPEYGQILYEDVTATVDFFSINGILRVEFYLDDELRYTDSSSPYQWHWVIGNTSPGTHTLKVSACDLMGNIAVDQIVVNIPEPDGTAPKVFSEALVIDRGMVEITFSEEIIDGLNCKNYSITPELEIIEIQNMGNNIYRLVTTGHTPLTVYTITVSNVTDLSGNLIDPKNNTAVFTGEIPGELSLITSMQGEQEGDYFGYSVAAAGDVNGDGFTDVIVGEYLAGPGGKAYLYFGGSNMNNQKDITLQAEGTDDHFGCSVASAGDINRDGYDDIIIGAKRAVNASGKRAGKAYIYYGGQMMNSNADIILSGANTYDYFGCAVSSAGDINADGYTDIIIGAKQAYTDDGNRMGKAYVYSGGPSIDTMPDVTLEEANGAKGEESDSFGYSVAGAGDVNGDGVSDIIVGAPWTGGESGKVYIYFGGINMDNISDISMAGFRDSLFGCSVSSAGDVNGDGFSDVIVGAPWLNSRKGKAEIYFGGSSMDNLPDITMKGNSNSGYFGISVSSAGDVNGDGFSDVIVGAFKHYLFSSSELLGKIDIYLGGVSMDNIAEATELGKDKGAGLGYSVAGAGDVNGDGLSDIIAGALQSSEDYKGKAYIYSYGLLSPRLNPEALAIDAHNVEISYFQPVQGALKAANYTILPNLGTITVSERGNNTYRLTTYLAQIPGEYYVITVNGITNADGIPIEEYHNQAVFYGYNGNKDNTPPAVPVVTDESRTTNSSTTLYAQWFSEDAESGIAEYQYAIGSKVENKSLIRDLLDWTSCGTATEITRGDLNLLNNTTYYFAVKAKNGAGLWSKPGISDGITVSQGPCAIVNIKLPAGNTCFVGDSIFIRVEVAEQASQSLEYQLLVDGKVKFQWNSSPDFVWNTTAQDTGKHTIEIQVRGDTGKTVSKETTIFIFRKAVAPPSS